MTHYSEAGKGPDQRPTDHKKYGSGYDLIWGKKKDDAQAEDQEFERIEREQRENSCQKENPSA
jgi:hypothetical protein